MRFMLEMNFAKALWFVVFHSISVFNNASFSIFESGLTPYKHDLAINIIITSLIIIGGLGKFGSVVADKLIASGHAVIIADKELSEFESKNM